MRPLRYVRVLRLLAFVAAIEPASLSCCQRYHQQVMVGQSREIGFMLKCWKVLDFRKTARRKQRQGQDYPNKMFHEFGTPNLDGKEGVKTKKLENVKAQ